MCTKAHQASTYILISVTLHKPDVCTTYTQQITKIVYLYNNCMMSQSCLSTVCEPTHSSKFSENVEKCVFHSLADFQLKPRQKSSDAFSNFCRYRGLESFFNFFNLFSGFFRLFFHLLSLHKPDVCTTATVMQTMKIVGPSLKINSLKTNSPEINSNFLKINSSVFRNY